MPAFTDVAGVPLTANRALLRDTLRDQWGFDGVVISDYGAIGELIRHGVAADIAEAAALALNAGVDIDMMSFAYRRGLAEALERGLVAHVRHRRGGAARAGAEGAARPLRRSYRRCSGPDPETAARRTRRRAAAREAATRSVVLLQNDGVLPLTTDGRIAVVGPLADAGSEMLGPWAAAGRGDEPSACSARCARRCPTRRFRTHRA